MGITQAALEQLSSLGLFKKSDMAVLDVGSSNLYSASPDWVGNFLAEYGPLLDAADVEVFAQRLAKGSGYDPRSGGMNESFVGELFEKAGFVYNAIDIADGYRTTIVDLNHQSTPDEFAGKFDLVLNYGTTEHLLNQYNAFRFMHEATKVGGYIVHSLPCVGYSNHGYLTYTPRCFFDLAGFNKYEVVDFRYDAADAPNDLFAPLRDYASYFPSLSSTLEKKDSTEAGRLVGALNVPDVSIFIVLRKVREAPFVGPMETSTSVGELLPASGGVGAATGRAARGGAARFRQLAVDLRNTMRNFLS